MKARRAFGVAAALALAGLACAVGTVLRPHEEPPTLRLALREAPLTQASAQELARYPEAEPGESDLLPRAFPGAPPQIPHTVEDMSIGLAGNDCLDCHDPENAEEGVDIPVPESHFMQPVLGPGKPDSPMAWVVRAQRKGDAINPARFFCTLCHVPQSLNARTAPSTFVRIEEKELE